MEIRDVDAGFAPQLVELWRRTFEDAYSEVHSRENIRAYCESNFTLGAAVAALTDPGTLCRIAFSDGKALGLSVVKHHECPVPLRGGSSELKQIYVLASEYGSGVGKGLLDALRLVRDEKRAWMWLAVSDLNTRAQSFYRKRLFKPLGAGPVFLVGSDRLTSTLMGREV